MAGVAVNEQPSSALPSPTRSTRLSRQCIVYAESTAHNNQTVSDIVRNPKSKFLQAAVYIQCAYFQINWLVLLGTDEPFDSSPFPKTDDMRLGDSAGNS